MQTQKKAIRKHFLSVRRRLSKGEVGFKSRRITEKLINLPEIQSAHYIHLFWPIQKNNEVDTRPLVQALTEAGKQCILPRMLSFSTKPLTSGRMEHCLYSGETNLRANRWDVYEPVSTDTVPVSRIDVVVVPALAVDAHGIRMGYGKGYYDELLAQVHCPTICPLFHTFFVDELPSEPHDIPVQVVATEKAVFRLQQ